MTNLQNCLIIASAAYTASGNSQDFPVGSVERIHIDVNMSALTGTGAGASFAYYRRGVDGVLYQVWQGALSAAGSLSVSIGPGMEVPKDPGATGVLVWTITGTTPSATFSVNVRGK